MKPRPVRSRSILFLAVALLGGSLSACSTASLPPTPPVQSGAAPEASPATAIRVGPAGAIPGFQPTEQALLAFRRACPRILKREDRSGLVQSTDWASACADPDLNPASFFARHFSAVRLGDGSAFVTGYYEPELPACKVPMANCTTPIYALPPDLAEIPLGAFTKELAGRSIRGRWTGKQFVPYASRSDIEDGALSGRGLELAYTPDPVGLFFLHIQGSGLLRYPDGQLERIGYAGQNGHAYVAIGRLLRERKLIEGSVGMQEIRSWLAANPEAGRALMRENPSYIFLRRLDPKLDGPVGSLGVPLIPQANVAIDPATTPYGAPIWLEAPVDGAPFRKLLIASDTGGAIRGANRLDLFFGPGPEAARIAGALQSRGSALILLPNAAADRLRP